MNNILLYEASEMMILNSNMFCSWRECFILRNVNTILIVLEYFVKDFCLWKMDIVNKTYLLNQRHKRYAFTYRPDQCDVFCSNNSYLSLDPVIKPRTLELNQKRPSPITRTRTV